MQIEAWNVKTLGDLLVFISFFFFFKERLKMFSYLFLFATSNYGNLRERVD